MYIIYSFGDTHPMPMWKFQLVLTKSLCCPIPVENPVACSFKSGLEPVEEQRDAGGFVGNQSDETQIYPPVKEVSTSKSNFIPFLVLRAFLSKVCIFLYFSSVKPKVTKRKLAATTMILGLILVTCLRL